MPNPKISIIIPAYNIQNSIARALDSCIFQSLKEIEILIVDDCGSDDTKNIAQKYVQKDPRIRIISNPQNLGTFHARFQGAKYAKGEYLCFLDGDDFLTKDACKRLYEVAQKHQVEVVFFGMKFFPPTFTKAPIPTIKKPLQNAQILHEVFLSHATPPWSICGKLYTKNLVDKAIKTLSFIDAPLVMAEDLLQCFVLLALAKNSIGISDRLYVYCESSSSITRDKKTQEKKINQLKKIIELFDALCQDAQLTSNPYFYAAKDKIQAILSSTIELQFRYDDGRFAYLRACVASARYHSRWQTYIRILGYVLSLGKIKL